MCYLPVRFTCYFHYNFIHPDEAIIKTPSAEILNSITSWTCNKASHKHHCQITFLQNISNADKVMKGMLIAASNESGIGDYLFLRKGYSGWDVLSFGTEV